ncbi:hypothetical protein I5X18_003989 [Salmonella enterica]|uniref:Uncharacterized protein n=1 Tax=Salmonella enterica subsp. houtenae serovar 48:z4,z32:- TaxID=2577535 RepID=A0A729G7B4_SALHO|nr:hypothetical protein [Salmonella enterica subsp. houtenae]EAA9527380.1 hypothetical protein [Salmonella enterica]EDX2043739.1 hypothetical protein [Salmonella enterica subsp. houtenae serovar 50:z4,z23:-]EEA9138882.1 hypothetical protein [Salmonella enterica subsp. enterica]EKR1449366.1 hypothetical protein [Salmonella enterica subsp. houtenae serovar 48:z4,z32:-]HCZ1713102.1 hypothetical protein [Salmonella enterica subsp. enterica serovar Montevideo str. 0269]
MDNQIQFYAKNELKPTSDELKSVVAGLTEAANHLHNQRQEAAIEAVIAMTHAVTYLHTQTIRGELLYKEEQKEVTETVASIICQIGNLNDEMMQVQKRISELEVKIEKQDVDAQELQRYLADISRNLDKMERERREHQRQLDDLNDRSAGRIILSILCLGLDRAILGIKSLIDQDAARIKILRDEMNRYSDALRNSENQLRVAKDVQVTLCEERKRNENNIIALEKQVDKLHLEEKNVRTKLAAITQVAGFYGKLKAVCEGVRKNIIWILDIIEELNDDHPRIVDIDASGLELVPLRTALAKLDGLLSTDRIQDTFANRNAEPCLIDGN